MRETKVNKEGEAKRKEECAGEAPLVRKKRTTPLAEQDEGS